MSEPFANPTSKPVSSAANPTSALVSTNQSTVGSTVPSSPVAAIILAAGKSTRMRSKTPKPLHPICGLPMTSHVVRACRAAGVEKIVIVIGHQAEQVRGGLTDDPGVEYVVQTEQRGTGDAVKAAQPVLGDWRGTILALAGDVPLLSSDALRRLISRQQETNAAAVLLTAMLDDPTGYGRVVRDENGGVVRIVEQKDATPEELEIKEWSPSLYAFEAQSLWSTLAKVQPLNAQGEYYLTDTIGLLKGQGATIDGLMVADAREVLGVNTRVELAAVAEILRERILRHLMLSGVSITDPASTFIDVDVQVGQDSVIEPSTFLYRGTTIGEDCVIGPMARIERSTLGDRVRILASQVVGSVLDDDVKVGPFANLRPGTRLGKGVKIGDFVEVKNSILAAGTQASHLAYIGDAYVGTGTNIGAGVITCNYDGYEKHPTIIGSNVFIGSNSTLVAPLMIGDGAFIAAGSPVTEDVPGDAMAIARVRPTIKPGWAAAYHTRQRVRKIEKRAV